MDKVIIAVGALLIAYAVYQTVQKLRGKAKRSCCGTGEVVAVKKVSDTDESHYSYRYRLTVEGMMCSNCAKNVENMLNSLPDTWGRVNLGRKEADVLCKKAMPKEAFEEAFNKTDYRLSDYRVVSNGSE